MRKQTIEKGRTFMNYLTPVLMLIMAAVLAWGFWDFL